MHYSCTRMATVGFKGLMFQLLILAEVIVLLVFGYAFIVNARYMVCFKALAAVVVDRTYCH